MAGQTGTDNDSFMEQARQEAAQCWCDLATRHIVLEPALAEAVARRIAGWMRMAAQQSEGSDYYRGLVRRCGEAIGERAYLCDDGTKADSVLCAKVPELVEELVACAKRTKEPWMQLSQDAIDRLDESDWLDYKTGRCLCAAHEKGECACGAWCK